MNRARVFPLLVPAVGAAVITLLLWLQPAGLLESYDLARMHQCYRHDLRATILAGEWPWWNPSTALGRPFFADVETAVLYPPSWLVLPLGVPAGIVAFVGLHLALAIAGTRRLARTLGIAEPSANVAGLCFALSGALLARIESGQLQLFAVVCLWPFVWDALLRLRDEPYRRSLVRAALWMACAFLAGSPALLWCGLIAAVPLVFGRETSWRSAGRTAFRGVGALVLAAALVAAQLLPFCELVQQGNRPLNDSTFATTGGVAGADWLSLFVPPGPWLHSNWESNLHVSILFVGLAVLAAATSFRTPEVRALFLTACLGLVLAGGDRTPVLPALTHWLPGFSGLRYPGRYGLMAVLAIVLLASAWLSRWAATDPRRQTLARVLLGAQLAIAVTGIFSQGLIYRAPAPALFDDNIRSDAAAEKLPVDGAPPRSALPVSLQRANAGAQSGTSTITGFNNPALARTWRTIYLLAGQEAPAFHRAEIPDDVLFKAAAHARYFSLSISTQPENLAVSYHAPAGPRTFVSFQPRVVARWEDAVEMIRTGHDFVTAALVETPAPEIPGSGTGSARITRFDRNQVVVETEADQPGLLVLAEAWYPGWNATIDGAPARVSPANGWMRAVVIPAGRHTVDFRFVPRSLFLGLTTTAIAAIVAAWLWRQTPTLHSAAHVS